VRRDGASVAMFAVATRACYSDTAAVDIGRTLLDPRLECLHVLERAGFDLAQRCSQGGSLLSYWGVGGSVAVMQHLLHAIAPADATAVNSDRDGASVLHEAVRRGVLPLVQLLLKARASVHSIDDGFTVLRLCIASTDVLNVSMTTFTCEVAQIAQALLDAGADVSEVDALG
jgi:ankyrin repeat protein